MSKIKKDTLKAKKLDKVNVEIRKVKNGYVVSSDYWSMDQNKTYVEKSKVDAKKRAVKLLGS